MTGKRHASACAEVSHVYPSKGNLCAVNNLSSLVGEGRTIFFPLYPSLPTSFVMKSRVSGEAAFIFHRGYSTERFTFALARRRYRRFSRYTPLQNYDLLLRVSARRGPRLLTRYYVTYLRGKALPLEIFEQWILWRVFLRHFPQLFRE